MNIKIYIYEYMKIKKGTTMHELMIMRNYKKKNSQKTRININEWFINLTFSIIKYKL